MLMSNEEPMVRLIISKRCDINGQTIIVFFISISEDKEDRRTDRGA